jgi:hypothetical protein
MPKWTSETKPSTSLSEWCLMESFNYILIMSSVFLSYSTFTLISHDHFKSTIFITIHRPTTLHMFYIFISYYCYLHINVGSQVITFQLKGRTPVTKLLLEFKKQPKFGVLWYMHLIMTFYVQRHVMPEICNSGVRKVLSEHPLLGNGLINIFLWQYTKIQPILKFCKVDRWDQRVLKILRNIRQ